MMKRPAKVPSKAPAAIRNLTVAMVVFSGFIAAHAAEVPSDVLAQTSPSASPSVKPNVGKPGPAKEVDRKRFQHPDTSMLEFLMAELASQRGGAETASSMMISLARRTNDAAIAKRAFEVAGRSGRLAEARAAAALWSELDPEGPAAGYLADFLANEGSLEAASLAVQKMLQTSGNSAPYLMQLNVFFARFPDKKLVREQIEKIATQYPNAAEAQYARTWAAYIVGDYTTANTHADNAMRLKPGWDRGGMAKMAVLKKAAADDKKKQSTNSLPKLTPLDFAQSFLQKNPKANDMRQIYARELAAEKRYAEAREQYKILTTERKDDSQLIVALGLLEQQLGNFTEAEMQLRKALTFAVNDEDMIYQSLAQIAEAKKDHAQAIEWLKRIDGPGQPMAQRQIAILMSKTEGLEKAREYLSQIPRDSKLEKISHALVEAQLFRDAKQLKSAFEALDQATNEFPDEVELLYDRAMAAERIDKLDVMERDLRKVIKLKPEFAHAYNALGYSLVERNLRLDDAKVLLEKAVALAPDDAFIIDSLGWLYYRTGNLQEAQKQLEMAYALRPDPEIAAHLSEVLNARGDSEAAKALLANALKKNPEHEALQSAANKLKLKP